MSSTTAASSAPSSVAFDLDGGVLDLEVLDLSDSDRDFATVEPGEGGKKN